jgi:membrane protease YdiL (CAAX protease family)
VTPRQDALRDTARYAGLAIGLSWASGVPAALGDRGGWLPEPLIGLGLVVFGVGPAVAALVIASRDDGRPGVRQLVRRFRHLRFPSRWWLAVPASAIGAAVTASAPLRHAGLPGPGATAVAAALASAPVIIAAAALEEVGWRGHLLAGLQRSIHPAAASLLVGVPWGIWHLPLHLLPDGPNVDVPVWAYPAGALAGAFVYTALFNATDGSLLVVTAVHAVRNIVSGIFLHDLPAGADRGIAYKADLALMLLAGAALFAVQQRSDARRQETNAAR